jgi:hypothetical protein
MKKKMLIVIFIIVLFLAYQFAVKEANVILPVDMEDVYAVTVRENRDGVYSSIRMTILSDDSRDNLINEINALQPVWDGKRIRNSVTWHYDYHVLYEVIVHYIPEKNIFRGEPVSHIYIADNGVIFAACDWFTMYHTDSENYDDFLLLLEEYAQECFVSYL